MGKRREEARRKNITAACIVEFYQYHTPFSKMETMDWARKAEGSKMERRKIHDQRDAC